MALHYILLRVSAPVGAINVIRTVGALDVGLDEDNTTVRHGIHNIKTKQLR
jgi:hypothetical protein